MGVSGSSTVTGRDTWSSFLEVLPRFHQGEVVFGHTPSIHDAHHPICLHNCCSCKLGLRPSGTVGVPFVRTPFLSLYDYCTLVYCLLTILWEWHPTSDPTNHCGSMTSHDPLESSDTAVRHFNTGAPGAPNLCPTRSLAWRRVRHVPNFLFYLGDSIPQASGLVFHPSSFTLDSFV